MVTHMSKTFRKTLVATALVSLATVATIGGVQAQTAREPMEVFGTSGHHFAEMHHADPAKVQAMYDKHMSRLKITLQLTPNQESDWTAFNSAMTPPAARPTHPSSDELEKLTTPERIDRLNALRAQRTSLLDKRAEATKRFYATLTPSQRKVFDLETLKYFQPKRGMEWLHHMFERNSQPK